MAKLALLTAILLSASAADDNLFKLDSDSIIIRTPQNLDDLRDSPAAQVLPEEGNHSIFSIDESKPVKDHVFFMEDDFYKPIAHDHKEATDKVLSLDELVEQVKSSDNSSAGEVSFEQEKAAIYSKIKEQEKRLETKDEVDPDLDRNNTALKANTSKTLENKYRFV
eukprot:CAMPEP_0170493830 /NCGR_PEP_ID=MMETSP0208-20121228/14292_1 /TAXON_ID=197538 /ORGANISM="Strombidium inclinatum, Strain S3" /LENGTH=165 /DNA_ID=CAMNT_0010769801 /DNA_START=13 /DNA_END=510 /DNA_ORIENTATION=-